MKMYLVEVDGNDAFVTSDLSRLESHIESHLDIQQATITGSPGIDFAVDDYDGRDYEVRLLDYGEAATENISIRNIALY